MAEKIENVMRKIRLEKLTINIGTKESGQGLEKAKKLLEKLTGKIVVLTKTHDRTTFGMPKGKPIGVKVTLRNKDALSFLKSAFQAVGNKLKECNFDSTGNFSFGVEEYINLPIIKYDPEIGIFGMDVSVTLQRPGYRIKNRMIKQKKLGKNHVIKKEDAIEFVKKEWGIKVD